MEIISKTKEPARIVEEQLPSEQTMDDTDSQMNSAISSDFKFTQINLLHCRSASAILSRHITVEYTAFALIQEPWYYVKCISQKYGSIIYNRIGKNPRAETYARSDIEYIWLPRFCTKDLVAIKIEHQNVGRCQPMVICSAYLPFDSSNPPPSFSSFQT